MNFDYVPTDDDFVKLKEGLRLACEIGLEAGALRVMPSTLPHDRHPVAGATSTGSTTRSATTAT